MIEGDLRPIEDALDHLAAQPAGGASERLEHVLQAAFMETQAVVHVITGNLKASGHTVSSETAGEWRGEIIYDAHRAETIYAWYEQRRGGTHDFMRPLEGIEERFERAIVDGL